MFCNIITEAKYFYEFIMKAEWGKKVNCTACAMPFYSMKKTSLVCPYCGHKFEISDVTKKRNTKIAIDEIIEDDDKISLSRFNEDDEVEEINTSDDDETSAKEVIGDMKLVD